VERTYRHTFHLQHKNQPNESKNQVIYKLHEVFSKQWSMRPMRLATTKTYNNKKESFKKYYYKTCFSIICPKNYQINFLLYLLSCKLIFFYCAFVF
jgi:hypothetical protein